MSQQVNIKMNETKIDIMTIFSHFVARDKGKMDHGDGEKNNIIALSPSEYKKQLLMNTEDRLEMLSSSRYFSKHERAFKTIPSIIIFQQFTAGNNYQATLTVTNVSKVLHYVRILSDPDLVFQVKNKGQIFNTRLAPGTSQSCIIKFSPQEKKDYEYKVTILSDFEKFTIPVIAVGPRPILDFLDQISIPETGVKIPATKIFNIRNIGDSVAAFTLSSSSQYFSIEPSRGVIQVEANADFTIHFLTCHAGSFTGSIFLKYDTGELLEMKLYGTARNCNVTVDPNKLQINDTFIGLSNLKTIKINNDSDHTIQFYWMKYKDIETDKKEKEKITEIYDVVESIEEKRYVELERFGICDSTIHSQICQRIFADDVSSLNAENFVYSNSLFTISPLNGKIFPRSTLEVNVIFQPEKIGEVYDTAYLEVTGIEKRLQVELSGVAKGPVLKLNTSTIDIEIMYLGSTFNYEIICANESLIPGTLIHQSRLTDFGSEIIITPSSQKIQPNQYKSFNLSITAKESGEFIEQIDFQIKEALEKLSLYIKGRIECPCLCFEKPSLNLGPTALGFTSKHEITLENKSPVSVNFKVFIPEDGCQSPVTFDKFEDLKNIFPVKMSSEPREFLICPSEVTLDKYSSIKLKINYTPNIVRFGTANMEVQILNSNCIPVILPISFEGNVAAFQINPREFVIRCCFINLPYTLTFKITNESNVEGICYFPEKLENLDDESGVFYSLPRHSWYIKPGHSKMASVTIISREIGRRKLQLTLMALGRKSIKLFNITCYGQGPTVSIHPPHLDWGNVKLFEEQTMKLKIENVSPINANFNAIIEKKNTACTVLPNCGEILPNKSFELIVKLFLRDAGKQSDKITLAISNTKTFTINSNAFGIGSSIITDPIIFPNIDIGFLSTQINNIFKINVTNEGNKLQQLIFSNKMELLNGRKNELQETISEIFSFEPCYLELPARSSEEIIIRSYSEKIVKISEDWWLYASTEAQKKKELIGMSTISATFLDPSVTFDKTELEFYINRGPNIEDNSEKIIEELLITNTSEFKLNTCLSIDHPFQIITNDNEKNQMIKIVFEKHEEHLVKIHFVCNETGLFNCSKTYKKKLKFEYGDHRKIENIKCIASVNFPKIVSILEPLRFNVPVGKFGKQNFVLQNDGPVPVSFHLSEVEENRKEIYSPSVILEEHLSTENIEFMEIKSMEALFEMSPLDGIIPPFSSQPVSCIYHARKAMHYNTEFLCEILQGPSEHIKIEARSDIIKYSLSEDHINFGEKIIFGLNHKILKFENQCKVNITYKIENLFENTNGMLQVKPNFGIIDFNTTKEIDVFYQPIVPGHFITSFKIELENISTIEITVESHGIIPQIYLDLPHIWSTKDEYFADKEYIAIQSLKDYYECSDDNEELQDEMEFIDNDWELIDEKENLPSVMEIDMAIENYMAREYISKNKLVLMNWANSKGYSIQPIPDLFSAEYILQLDYVIIEQTTSRSILLHNFAEYKLSIHLKKFETINYLSKYGISIKFKDANLLPNEFCKLDILIRPPREKPMEMNKKIKRKIYLEVANGFTIPITIIAVITSPSLTPSTNVLNFDEVHVGYCKKMSFKIQNNGLVDSHWKIETLFKKNENFPFSFSPTNGVFTPGEFAKVDVFFKPKKNGISNTELIINVNQSLEHEIIVLTARGIEPKLKISETCINFPIGVPYVTVEKFILNIKNIGQSPVEFYWNHLDKISIEEDQIIRILAHYYMINEILLPPRKIGHQLLPEKIYNFYYSLINDMKYSLNDYDKELSENDLEDEEKYHENSASSSRHEKLKPSVEILENKNLENIISSIEYNSIEIEDLLHNYIDKLQEKLDFQKTMQDPLGEIFKEYNKIQKDVCVKKKLCLIFHGAPFTQYQESACKTARKLNVPLINIDKCFIESIALGDSPSSSNLRNLIDTKYQELLSLASEFINSNLLDENTKQLYSELIEEKIIFSLPQTTNNPFKSFKKIPDIEKLDILDSLSKYEYKIMGIDLLERILNISGTSDGIKNEKNKKKETFLDVDLNVISDILKRELLQKNLEHNIVIQTLKNNFILDDVLTFSTILKILEPIKFIALVTFHNTLEIYDYQTEKIRREIAAENEKKLAAKLKKIDEMSALEFQALSEEDQNLYFEKVHRPRIEEARLRRQRFDKKSEINQINDLTTHDTEEKDEKSFGKKLTKSKKLERQLTVTDIKNKENRSKIINSNKNSEKKEEISKDVKTVAEAMKAYELSLASIEVLIETQKKHLFHIWHIQFSDPWNSQIYNSIVDQIVRNVSESEIIFNDESQENFEAQLFSLVLPTKHFLGSLSHQYFPFKLFDSLKDEIPEPRIILQPGEEKAFIIIFQPNKIGHFRHEYILSFVGNNGFRKITVNGTVDIPNIKMEPTSLFPKVKNTKIDETNGPTFFIDNNIFDFGSLLVKQKKNQVHRKVSSINFFNSSLVYVNAEFSLKNQNSSAFSFDPPSLFIKPKEIGILTITGTALKIDENIDNLLVTVKNNPRVEIIQMRTFGCIFNVEFINKNVAFGRILKFQKAKKIVIMRNKLPIPIFWKSRRPESMNEQITFSPKSGWIRPYSDGNIEIYYLGHTIGLIKEISITIDMYLQEINNDILKSDIIKITGETYDINIHVENAHPINFGTVKIGTKSNYTFTIKNNGKYEINYAIECDNHGTFMKTSELNKQFHKNIKNELQITPQSNVLLPNKVIDVKVDFTPRMEMNFQEISILKCNLFEGNKRSITVARIPLSFSILARYPKFNIQPYPELMFGPLTINTHKTLYFSIQNTGLFPIKYKISTLKMEKHEITDNENEETSKKIEKLDEINVGPFTLKKIEGNLEVEEIENIMVDAFPQTEGQFIRNIFISLPESFEDVKSKLLKFSVQSCIPKIDFNNIDYIFQDSYIVNDFEEFICSLEEPHSIFSKKDSCLYFENVIVSTSHSVDLRLHNPSLVTAEVSVTIQHDSIIPNDTPLAFIVEPENISIASLETETIKITFSPKLIKNYSCELMATVILPSELLTCEKLSIKLIGNSCMPEIVLIEPPVNLKRGHSSLEFGPCLIGDISHKIISFRNDSKIGTEVSIEINDKINSPFSLKKNNKIQMGLIETSGDNSVQVISHPGECIELMVFYQPNEKKKNESQVQIFVANNPYEHLTIDLRGEGFVESVVLEGLPLLMETMQNNSSKENMKSKRLSKQKSQAYLTYELKIDTCFIGRPETQCFKIINKSKDKYFRFEWISYSGVTFSPSIGHLCYFDSKDITMTFIASLPITHTQTILSCKIDEITQVASPRGITWDNRHLAIDWKPLENIDEENQIIMTRIQHSLEEPYYEITKENQRLIQLLFSTIADYSTYSCRTEEINFNDTFVFQKSKFTFFVENPGIVDLVYKWKITQQSKSTSSLFDTMESGRELNLIDDLQSEISNESFAIVLPFTIIPQSGVILSGQSQECTLQFSPQEIDNYQINLVCEIDNLNPEIKPLKIFITGASLPSYYHIDLPESTWSTKHLSDLPNDIRVLEFKVMGVGKNHSTALNLTNPTKESYHFSWNEKTVFLPQEISYFHCVLPEGSVESEKTTKIIFTFFAEDVGIFESLWMLSIEEYKIKVPVLLVATVKLPLVACCTSKVTLEPTCLGRKIESTIKITNKENISLSFNIIKDSLLSEGRLKNLTIEPASGILEPQKDQLLRIVFKPWRTGNVNFNLKIEIEKMKKPLKIGITGTVLEIDSRLTYSCLDDEEKEIKKFGKNIIDLGKIMIKKPRIINFFLSNLNEFPFDYQWEIGLSSNNFYKILIDKIEGTIEEKTIVKFVVKIIAKKSVELKNQPLFFNVIKGSRYCLLLNALATNPQIEFSFSHHNFGPCYITESSRYKIHLKITNHDEEKAVVECNFENLPYLKINHDEISRAILPKCSARILMYFQPQEEKSYKETLKFVINSVIKNEIIITGQGIPYKIHLVNSRDKFIDLGNVSLGKTVKRKILVVNLGKVPVEVEFTLTKDLSSEKEKFISIDSLKSTILHPNKPQDIIIKVKPMQRMESFEEKIGAKVDLTIIPLFIIRGKCSAAEFYLNRSCIPFGKAIEGFPITEKLVLHNPGDVGAKFKWSVETIQPNFDIVPAEGYSLPGSSTIFTATYCALGEIKTTEVKAILKIKNQKILTVLLCGESSKIPDPIETIIFKTPVRSKKTKSITITNILNISEKFIAVLSGNYFTSDNDLTSMIPSNSSKTIDITYTPLIMNSLDSGMLVLHLINKKIIQVYKLQGSSIAPDPVGKIIREIPAKIKHVESFLVNNWLNKPQFFISKIDLITFSKDNPIYKFFFVNDGIDIPAKSMRHYGATFHCYNESILHFNVSFTNSEGEYQYYDVEYHVTKPQIIESIQLSTTARIPIIHYLVVENPLEESITYSAICQNNNILIEGVPKILAPNSTDKIAIHYHPMFPTESVEQLNISCSKLGEFPYQLNLKAEPSLPEKMTQVFATLGNQVKTNILIKNCIKEPAKFTIISDNPSFTTSENHITIPGLENRTIELIYEPSSIGTTSGNLTASSHTAGEIIYPIIGSSTLPKPQGPFMLTPNQPLTITFKNIFKDAKTFEYVVEPTISFSTGLSSNLLSSKQIAKILVSFRGPNGFENQANSDQYQVTGKLIVYCTDPDLSHINWIYYLNGITNLK